MKRLLAFAGLFVVCAGPVTADYLFIKIDLKKLTFGASGGNTGQPGMPQGMPGAPEVQPGGQPGFQPKGFPGGMPGMMKGKGAFGGKGMLGGMPAAGGGFAGGMPGGGGFAGGMPAAGAGAGGGMPAAGGFAGMQPGGPMGPMNPDVNNQFGGPQAEADADLSSHIVVAIVELKNSIKPVPGSYSTIFEADHYWGRKGRFPLSDKIEYKPVYKQPNIKEYKKAYGKDLLDANDASRLVQAAAWALGHGLTKEFHNAMATLAKVDAKHPAVVNYLRVQAELKKAPDGDDPATQGILNDLKGEQYRVVTSEGGHYGLLTKSEGPQHQAALKRRLARFEDAFDAFFYWFALQESAPQPAMPRHRLYAVLVDAKEDFQRLHADWGSQPMVADGFTPRRNNLIIVAARRLDENFTTFDKNAQMLLGNVKIHRDDLVSGAVWDRAEAKGNIAAMSGIQVIALMQKALEEEGEKASISHEAARQLLYATGMLPRLVNVPEWAQFGLASYFDTPHGALYGGVGLPSWSNLVSFKYFRKTNKLGTKSETLIRTISDRYFRDAAKFELEQKDVPEKDKKEKQLHDKQDIARGTAWALAYYLLHEKKLPELARYTAELSDLPRDLELDEAALQACFGKAFGLSDAKDPRRLDPRKVSQFADAWFGVMDGVNLEARDAEVILTDARYPAPARRPVGNTNNPNGLPQGFAPPGVNPGFAPPGVNPGIAPPGAVGPRGGN
jgi:Protein of unknown function (DUF1570)